MDGQHRSVDADRGDELHELLLTLPFVIQAYYTVVII